MCTDMCIYLCMDIVKARGHLNRDRKLFNAVHGAIGIIDEGTSRRGSHDFGARYSIKHAVKATQYILSKQATH